MSLPWFRMYAEFAKDPKVQSMDETLQRRLVMMFCLKCSEEINLSHDELACAMRISSEELETTLEVFRRKGFMDANDEIVNWEKRQPVSANSTARVRKYRERQKKRPNKTIPNNPETARKRFSNGEVTALDTDKTACAADGDADRDAKNVVSESPSHGKLSTRSESLVHRVAKKKATRRSQKKQPTFDFEELKRVYPKRAGGQSWNRALRACNTRLKGGEDWQTIIEGARRYAAWCDATDTTGTEFVKQAATFCGPDKHYLELWEVPRNKGERRFEKNVAASVEWLNETA